MLYFGVASLVAVVCGFFVGRSAGQYLRSRGRSITQTAIFGAVVGGATGAFLGVLIALGAGALGVVAEKATPENVAAMVGFGCACSGLGGGWLAGSTQGPKG